jgi:hypothetical protein
VLEKGFGKNGSAIKGWAEDDRRWGEEVAHVQNHRQEKAVDFSVSR